MGRGSRRRPVYNTGRPIINFFFYYQLPEAGTSVPKKIIPFQGLFFSGLESGRLDARELVISAKPPAVDTGRRRSSAPCCIQRDGFCSFLYALTIRPSFQPSSTTDIYKAQEQDELWKK